MSTYATVFEILMIAAFGASWPLNIRKAYRARTAKGTSLAFSCLIEFGYACGILSKILAANWTALKILAFCFYILNFIMVGVAIFLYFRNRRFDRIAEKKEA